MCDSSPTPAFGNAPKRQHREISIYSGNRDTAAYPNANSYQIVLPFGLQRLHVAYLSTFVGAVPVGAPLTANLRIREFVSSGKSDTTWSGGDGSTLACIPLTAAAGTLFSYQPSSARKIDVLRFEDSTYYPSFTTLTLSWIGENGQLIPNFPEHVVKIMLESVYY